MSSPHVEPHRLARIDQWNAMLDDMVAAAAHHRADDCVQPPGLCAGTRAGDKIDALEPVEARVLLELAIVRFAGQRTVIYEPSFVCWVPNRPGEDPDDHEHDHTVPCEWGWVCNVIGCNFRTDDTPCPDHAPTDVPELRLVECNTEPRQHWIWVHRNDDYGHGCPACWSARLTAKLEPLQHKEMLHVHRWCWLSNRVKRALVWLRVMRILKWSSDCRYGWHVSAVWRWAR